MSTRVVEEYWELTDSELDEKIRQVELAGRRLQDERSSSIALAEARQLHAADGHRSIAAYLRATCNWSPGEVTKQRKLARLINEHPEVGDALDAGRIGVDQALEISRVHTNRRIRHLTSKVLPTLLEQAEHLRYADLVVCVNRFIMLTDLDGAFDDMAANVEHRTALVTEIGGALHVQASGGDALTAASLVVIFERFVEVEFRKDIDARRAEFGDRADEHPLARSAAQRSFDALQTIFELASEAADDGRQTPGAGSIETVVNIVCDARTISDTFVAAGLTLPGGRQVDLDDLGAPVLSDLVDAIGSDPASLVDRRCETSAGTLIHPALVLRAALTSHIRRVVVDSSGVVIDLGRRQRLFTGNARVAAKLLARHCSHPGCTVGARFAEVDHIDGWSDANGRTDQRNADIECGGHNRFKHRHGWRTRRDATGRKFSVRPDGTIVLPVGEREPDLAIDHLERLARCRVSALRFAEPVRC